MGLVSKVQSAIDWTVAQILASKIAFTSMLTKAQGSAPNPESEASPTKSDSTTSTTPKRKGSRLKGTSTPSNPQ